MLKNLFLFFLSFLFIYLFFTDPLNNDENVHFYYSYFIHTGGNLYFDIPALYGEVVYHVTSIFFSSELFITYFNLML